MFKKGLTDEITFNGGSTDHIRQAALTGIHKCQEMTCQTNFIFFRMFAGD